MLIADAKASLDAFFQDRFRKVLLLKGPWGAGKSHFVRDYLVAPKSSAPSYQHFASLFGLSSLTEVKETINACLEVRSTSATIKAAQKHSMMIAVVGKQAKKLVDDYAPRLPMFSRPSEHH